MEEQIDVKYLPLWSRYLDMFRDCELSRVQVGQLVWMMMEYQFEGKVPETVPKALRMAWTFIRKDLDDARGHYEMRVQNGRKGGRKKQQPEPMEAEKNRDEPKGTETNRCEVMSTSTSSSTSTSTSTTASASSSIDTGSAPASPAEDAGVCLEKQSFGEFGWVKLTQMQYQKLAALMGEQELRQCIAYVDEAAQSNGNRNRWKDWYLVLRRCYDKRWYEARSRGQEIPKGASGVLGQAELEAIQRVLRE